VGFAAHSPLDLAKSQALLTSGAVMAWRQRDLTTKTGKWDAGRIESNWPGDSRAGEWGPWECFTDRLTRMALRLRCAAVSSRRLGAWRKRET